MREEYRRFMKNYEDYKEVSESLDQADVTMMDYKAVACGVGTYPQREERHMLRLRVPGGRLLKEQLKTILEICGRHSVKMFKMSTGQSVQLHDLSTDQVRAIMPEMWEHDILTMGTGGNNPANVMASPLAGVEEGEFLNVMPYAEAASHFLVDSIGVLKLPRKFKVGFDGSDANETHATFKDMGFSACPDGTFEVYAAGGLGIQPRLGVKIAEHVAPEDILYYLKAMMLVFSEKGNYLNWKKARSRYLQETLGVEELKQMVNEYAARLMQEEDLKVRDVKPYVVEKSGDGEAPDNYRIRAQKQPGLYSVLFHSLGAFVPYDRLKTFYELTAPMKDVEYRLTVDGGIYAINLTAKEAERLVAETPDGARTEFETSVSCVGRSRCAIGACNSQKLLEDCMVEVVAQGFKPGVLPRISVSGCISSCSAHQASALGFRGIIKRTSEGVAPAFYIFWGGNDRKGEEVLAESDTIMLGEDIPFFLVELGKTIQNSGETYKTWIEKYPDRMKALIERYTFS